MVHHGLEHIETVLGHFQENALYEGRGKGERCRNILPDETYQSFMLQNIAIIDKL